jgi:hypothetical protein
VFAESELLTDVVNGGPLDLSRRDGDDRLDIDPALVLIATESAEVFAPHDLEPAAGLSGELRLNPLYAAESEGNLVRLRLQFPSAHYAEEFSACRQYLPESVVVSQGALEAVADGRLTREVADLARLRVVLDLPRRYY